MNSAPFTWGMLRPQVCFGARAPLPSSPLFGLVWWRAEDSGDASRYRHMASLSSDAVSRIVSVANDGTSRGVQLLTDDIAGVEIRTEFLLDPKAPSSFQATITVSPQRSSSSTLCVAYYCASQGASVVFSDDIAPPSPAEGHAYDMAFKARGASSSSTQSVVELLAAAAKEDILDRSDGLSVGTAVHDDVWSSIPPTLLPSAATACADEPMRFRVAATLATAPVSVATSASGTAPPQLRSLRLHTKAGEPWNVVPPLAAATAAVAVGRGVVLDKKEGDEEQRPVVVTIATVAGACELQVTVTDFTYAAAAAAVFAVAKTEAKGSTAGMSPKVVTVCGGKPVRPLCPLPRHSNAHGHAHGHHDYHEGSHYSCSDASLESFELVHTLTPSHSRTPSPFASLSVASSEVDDGDGEDVGHAAGNDKDADKNAASVAPSAQSFPNQLAVPHLQHPSCAHALPGSPLPVRAPLLRAAAELKWQRMLGRLSPQRSQSLCPQSLARAREQEPLPVPKEFLSQTVAALVGGLTYIAGRGRWMRRTTPTWGTEGEYEEVPIKSIPEQELLCCSPSRAIFPRGFLWDEGFHWRVLQRVRPGVAGAVMRGWAQLVAPGSPECANSSAGGRSSSSFVAPSVVAPGWLPREQCLGPEAESAVPPEFRAQRDDIANPQTLIMALDEAAAREGLYSCEASEGSRSEFAEEAQGSVLDLGATTAKSGPTTSPSGSSMLELIKGVYPSLSRHLRWFLRSQAARPAAQLAAGSAADPSPDNTVALAWVGRTLDHCLASGLDDYPRSQAGPAPTGGVAAEVHVDAQSWGVAACAAMARMGRVIAAAALPERKAHDKDESDVEFFDRKARELRAALSQLCFDPAAKAGGAGARGQFGDLVLYAAGGKRELEHHDGYVALIPLALGLLSPPTPALARARAHATTAASGLRAAAAAQKAAAAGAKADVAAEKARERAAFEASATEDDAGRLAWATAAAVSSAATAALDASVAAVEAAKAAAAAAAAVAATAALSAAFDDESSAKWVGKWDPVSNEFDASIALLSDAGVMGSAGPRSLSRKDPLWGTKEDYWRGAVWAPVVFLLWTALSRAYDRLSDAEKTSERGRHVAKMRDAVRKRFVDAVVRGWEKDGCVREQYDGETGEGRRGVLFTGWTSTAVLMAQGLYD